MKKYMIATLFISGLLVGSASAFRRAAVTAPSINVHDIRNQEEAQMIIRNLEKQKEGSRFKAKTEALQMEIDTIKKHFNIQ